MEEIRLGIAGIGAIGEQYIGLYKEGKLSNCRLLALASRNKENRKRVISQYQLEGIKDFGDYKEMLESGLIDAVIVCTPHYHHVPMAIEALRHGIHVLLEKPIAVDGGEAEQLIGELKHRPDLVGGVLYNRRKSHLYRKVKSLVEDNAIGELKRANWLATCWYRTNAYYESSPWRATYQGEGGGLLLNQAAHHLDMLQWLTPMPVRISGFCYCGMERNIETENDAVLLFEYENGATGQFIASAREYPGSNRLELIGDQGQIVIEEERRIRYRKLLENEKVFNRTCRECFGRIPYEEKEFIFEDDSASQAVDMLNNFTAAIGKKEPIACPFTQAVKSLYVINGAYLSSWLKRPVELPLPAGLFKEELAKKIRESVR